MTCPTARRRCGRTTAYRAPTARRFIRVSSHDKAELIIRKGFRPAIDSYSAFFENDHTTQTGLAGYLRERGIRTVTIAGLATDYCVAYSALDSVGRGFTTNIRLDACRGIDLGGTIATMLSEMKAAGVARLLDG